MENLDVRTCEQYVLTVLEATLEANNDLVLENRLLETRIKQLESQLNAKPSRLEEYVNSYGRQKLFEDLTYSGWDTINTVDSNGEQVPFRVWWEERMRNYGRPKWLSTAEFIDFFEPEFRKEYEEATSEEQK